VIAERWSAETRGLVQGKERKMALNSDIAKFASLSD